MNVRLHNRSQAAHSRANPPLVGIAGADAAGTDAAGADAAGTGAAGTGADAAGTGADAAGAGTQSRTLVGNGARETKSGEQSARQRPGPARAPPPERPSRSALPRARR
ncbi:hypothetical protein EV139_2336 [Leucobacter luti]|uniref:Uncharacterized protein n=1 Tax=Leucobacter luti TaxID=340320 RepID=A0A4V6MBY0_9MICO|nr:hypothetical protein EV139_2336 [Leucobacter luti]